MDAPDSAAASDGGRSGDGGRLRRNFCRWVVVAVIFSASFSATEVVAWSSPQQQQRQLGRPVAPQYHEATAALLRLSSSLLDDDDDETEVVLLGAEDPAVLDALFRVGEIMSQPPSGGVTRASFVTMPVITTLSGLNDQDLSPEELQECWAEGSLGKDRVDRAGFERVMEEIQEYFDGDIIDEARKTSHTTKPKNTQQSSSATNNGTSESRPLSPPKMSQILDSLLLTAPGVVMDAQMSPDDLAAQVRSVKDEDLMSMLSSMINMNADEEARIRSVGDDPDMVKKTYEMMKINGFARKAAMMAMKATSPELMKKALDKKEEWYRRQKADELF